LKERLERGLERCSWDDRREIVSLLVDKVEVVEAKLRVHYIVPLGRGPQPPGTPPLAGPAESTNEKRDGPRHGLLQPCPHDHDHDYDHEDDGRTLALGLEGSRVGLGGLPGWAWRAPRLGLEGSRVGLRGLPGCPSRAPRL